MMWLMPSFSIANESREGKEINEGNKIQYQASIWVHLKKTTVLELPSFSK